MFEPGAVPDISKDEILARFVLFTRWYNASDYSVRQDAFMPPQNLEFSVTRRREATEDEIWNEAKRVAALRQRPLYGRADVSASDCTAVGLNVKADPVLPWNPNHAIIIGWPNNKPEQKLKALQIASKARFLVAPA